MRSRPRTAGTAAGGSRAPPPPLRRCRAAASTPRGGAAPRYCLRRHPGPAGAAGAEQSGGGGRRPRGVTARAGPGSPTPRLPTTAARGGPAVTETRLRPPPRGPVRAGRCSHSPARGRRRSVTRSAGKRFDQIALASRVNLIKKSVY